MDEQPPTEPFFRTSKRRKVFRKRSDTAASDEQAVADRHSSQDDALPERQSSAISDHEDADARVLKRPHARRHGIGFSSTASRRVEDEPHNESMALVPVDEAARQDLAQNDRFVKPTGRAAVTEDKHMMAYVDTKLAEIRSAAAIPTNSPNNGVISASGGGTNSANAEFGYNDPSGTARKDRTFQQAQAKSTRIYQRPTKRRAPPARNESDVARDSMIDQLMRENQVPIYDCPTSQTPSGEAAGDNDAATADAFKAQLLADMELNRRRPAKTSTTASNGPKLGGSRSQREKMKATEEANKGSTGKK